MFWRSRTFRLEHVGSASPHGGTKDAGGPGGPGVGTGSMGGGTGVTIAGGGVFGDGLGVDSGGSAVGPGEPDGSTVDPHPTRISAAVIVTPIANAELRRARNAWLKI